MCGLLTLVSTLPPALLPPSILSRHTLEYRIPIQPYPTLCSLTLRYLREFPLSSSVRNNNSTKPFQLSQGGWEVGEWMVVDPHPLQRR